MSARKILLILLALVIAGGTVHLVRNWAGNRGKAQAEREIPKLKVMVAAAPLAAGTLVREEHLRWQVWPAEETLPDTYFIESKDKLPDFVGTVVRQSIAEGEPVTEGRIVRPGQSGFLAAVLEPGMRAVSVPVNATTGIAGFVFPGDRVDLILTQKVNRQDDESLKNRRASETVLRNVRILAMDQKVNDQEMTPEVARIATFEVSPKQAEIIAVVVELGRLSLSLRSLARDEESGKKADYGLGRTWDSDASRVLPAPVAKVRKVQVVRAGKVDELDFERGKR